MPKVNGKSFPYTPKGMAAAEKAEYSPKTPKAMKVAAEKSEGGPSNAVKRVSAKKAALKKKAASSKPMSMKEAMKGLRVIPSTGATPQKAAPTGMKMKTKVSPN